MLPSLEQVLMYAPRPAILERYRKDYPSNQLPAEEAFHEVVKYLWLCEKHRDDRQKSPHDPSLNFIVAIHKEMKEMDDMWHTFILFTKEYMEFGQRFFGHYLHHAPTAEEDKLSAEEFKRDLECYLSYVYDNLGEQTLRKWFAPLLT